jgi:hypothetical protein
MNIDFIEIQNFRKLKSCRVEIASQETILVGANNSGKTSAMDAMILFLKKSRRKDIATTDFTLSNWEHINNIGKQWAGADEDNKPDLTLDQWFPYLPSIDIWLEANDVDIHHIIHLLPTLDWKPLLAIPNQLPHQKINASYLYGLKRCGIFWIGSFTKILTNMK